MAFDTTWVGSAMGRIRKRAAAAGSALLTASAETAETSLKLVGDFWSRPSVRLAVRRIRQGLKSIEAFGARLTASLLSGSLQRRIFLSNILGLAVLIVGIFTYEQRNAWLIDAKREALMSEGEIIARAIAANARVDKDGSALDVGRLADPDAVIIPQRDDSFASLDNAIRPERVTSVLKKLIEPTTNRARIYARDYSLVVDSIDIISRGTVAHPTSDPKRDARASQKPRNLVTRLTEYFLGGELPVYREIGRASGFAYPEVRTAMSTGTTVPLLLVDDDDREIVSVAVPIERVKTVIGVLLLSTKPGEIDKVLWRGRWNLIEIAAFALLTTLLASTLLARTVAGPLKRLSSAADQVSRNINARRALPDYSGGVAEIRQLGEAFRSMTSALFKRIEASEKFAADVAHELKNPLTAARATAENLSLAKTEEQRAQLVQQVQEELKRLNRLITDVSKASRLDAELARQQNSPVDLRSVLSGVTQSFNDMLQGDGRQIALSIDPAAGPVDLVVGHEGRLAQVLTNLIDNAVSFSPKDGVVSVAARRKGADVVIEVSDQGRGIPPDKLEAIFDRFYSDRPETDSSRGKNSGLGLSISREIVNAHHGRIWAENITPAGAGAAAAFHFSGGPVGPLPSVGAKFTVIIPVATPAAIAELARRPQPAVFDA